MTGHGGWPLNVFLTPEQLPFYGGTYFPPEPRHGMPALDAGAAGDRRGLERAAARRSARAASACASAFRRRAADAVRASRSTRAGARRAVAGAGAEPTTRATAASAARAEVPAGLGARVPAARARRPRARRWRSQTLRAMAAGGIHDQIGGGFHRYSVDATWTVPHFEKMLYDNALLARAYLHGWQALRRARACARSAATRSTGRCARCAAPRAASTRRWTPTPRASRGASTCGRVAELRDALGEDADAAIAWFGATEQGNFEDPHHPEPGLNVLTGPRPRPATPQQRERIRARLLAARERRERPALDDKRLTSWNALMIAALADAGAALGASARYARRGGRLRGVRAERPARRARAGCCAPTTTARRKIDAYLEDHAFLLEALIALFEASCEERWFDEADALADELIERFADPEHGGFFSTASDGEALITGARISRTPRSPPAPRAPRSACCVWRSSPASERYERHALGALALLARDRPAPSQRLRAHAAGAALALLPARPIACAVPESPPPSNISRPLYAQLIAKTRPRWSGEWSRLGREHTHRDGAPHVVQTHR